MKKFFVTHFFVHKKINSHKFLQNIIEAGRLGELYFLLVEIRIVFLKYVL